MAGIELLKVALNEGVKVLPPNFLEDNNINSRESCLFVMYTLLINIK